MRVAVKERKFTVKPFIKEDKTQGREKDMMAVTTPVATPREKEPLKTPRNIPKDLSIAMTSKVWLLSPCGW